MSSQEYIWIGLFALLICYIIFTYNRLVALSQRSKNSFGQIDVQLQRRYDLIPNLVETAKSYMKHERETLEAVVAARNAADGARKTAAGNPDMDNIKQLSSMEAGLAGSLSRMFAVVENYPDLKANQNMSQLMEELTHTENTISFARQAYNDAVMLYNTAREQFPSSVIAGLFRFREAALYTVESPDAKKAVKVQF